MALFVPNPDRESVEELIEDLSRELAIRYQGAEDELIREIAVRARREMILAQQLPTAPGGLGLTVAERRRQNRILAELAAHRAVALRELQAKALAIVSQIRSDDMARRLLEIAATEGEAAAAAQLRLAARQVPAAAATPLLGSGTAISATTLTGTATQAVGALVLSLESRLEVLNQRITRYPQDAYQRIVSIYTPNTLLGVTTSHVQQAQAVTRFLAEGITDFVDRGGRRWTIGAYAEMAGRTSVNRAFNDAGMWRMQQSGINLVTVVRGLDSCARCAAWAGKILSTDGTPAGFVELPTATGTGTVTVQISGTVDQARNAGWNHPNCRCRLVPFLAGLTVPQDDTTYDEAAEKERAQQRSLERDIRAAKRREAVAPDDVSRARARADVREAQASMREFIGRTGRNRSSYREQLHFADGRGAPRPPAPPRAPRTPPTSPASSKKPRGGVDIRIRRDTPIGAAVHASRSSIAKVHTIPRSAPTVEVVTARLRPGENGVYRGSQSILQMSADGPSPRLTFAHEVGHYLDHTVLGTVTTNFESRMLTDPRTQAWLDAVNDSESVRRLQALRVDPATPADIRQHIEYLTKPVELWGRSYAQYIATRSADATMLAEIGAFRASPDLWTANRQWGTTEFEPVAAAIDEILRGKGLLK